MQIGRRIGRRIAMHACAVGVLAFAFCGAVYAWVHLENRPSLALETDLAHTPDGRLEISCDGGVTWNGTAKLPVSGLTESSGDGMALYTPNDGGYVAAEPCAASGGGGYVEYALRFRSAAPMTVYLDGMSQVVPQDDETQDNMFGDFSTGYIAGAVRLAVIDNAADIPLRVVWAPNPTYQLRPGADGRYTFTEKGEPEADYAYYNGSDFSVYNDDDYAAGRFVAGVSAPGAMGAALFSLRPVGGQYATRDVVLRVWVEGTDREASEALAGGRFRIHIQFTGIPE